MTKKKKRKTFHLTLKVGTKETHVQLLLTGHIFVNFTRWYAKRFLHPDVVAAYDYIFIWDEDLGLKNFNAEK